LNLDDREFRSLHAEGVKFNGVSSFENMTVLGSSSFINCEFESMASFAGADFLGPVSFRGSRFHEVVEFSGASFGSIVSFVDCVFERGVSFGRPSGQYAEPALFGSFLVATGASFGSVADFNSVRFQGHVDAERLASVGTLSFAGAVFDQGGTLSETEVLGTFRLSRVAIISGSVDVSHSSAAFVDLEGIAAHHLERLYGLETVRSEQVPYLDDDTDESEDVEHSTKRYAPGWSEPAYVEEWDRDRFTSPIRRRDPEDR
jgi:hypothetical protein